MATVLSISQSSWHSHNHHNGPQISMWSCSLICSLIFPWLTLFQPHWPPYSSLNIPSMLLLPQDICTRRPLCAAALPPDVSMAWSSTSCRCLHKYQSVREVHGDTTSQNRDSIFPSSLHPWGTGRHPSLPFLALFLFIVLSQSEILYIFYNQTLYRYRYRYIDIQGLIIKFADSF